MTIDYPWYFVLFCLLLGSAYAFSLYWFKSRNKSNYSLFTTIVLSVLRTVAVSAIAFLLLSPLLRRQSLRKEKPIVIIAEDNSKSLDYCKDSAFYQDQFHGILEEVAGELSKDFNVQRFCYGAEVVPLQSTDHVLQATAHSSQATDMSLLFDEIKDRYWHRNVGAVVVTGDGIYNKGDNPVSKAQDLAVPVYTIAMGDTSVRRDVSLTAVRFNKIAYLGNQFPLEITVGATRLKGARATLSVKCEGNTLFSKQLEFSDDRQTIVESVIVDAHRSGLHNYTIEISPLRDEVTYRNNRRVVTVEIIDGRRKVAIIAATPHPDIAALRRSIEENQNFEVSCFLSEDFKGNAKDYDLLVLHQLPAKSSAGLRGGISIPGFSESSRIPVIFVLGSQTDLARFNALHTGLEVFARIDRCNDATPLRNKDFTSFTLSDNTLSRIEQFPPLMSPFGEYKLTGNSQTLFFSKIGSLNSGSPLVAVTQQNQNRYAFIAGEGLWRWRLVDWQSNQSHSSFNELVTKLVTFTALRADNEKFRVENENVYGENDHVILQAQLYDDNYEVVNTPEVKLTLTNHTSQPSETSDFTFNRTPTAYSINLGSLASGEYRYLASTSFNGHNYTASGGFIVEDSQLEAATLVADHSLLATLSATTGGQMLQANDAGRIVDIIRSRDDLKTVVYTDTRYSDMLNIPLVFIFIITLLATEWIIRKYNS